MEKAYICPVSKVSPPLSLCSQNYGDGENYCTTLSLSCIPGRITQPYLTFADYICFPTIWLHHKRVAQFFWDSVVSNKDDKLFNRCVYIHDNVYTEPKTMYTAANNSATTHTSDHIELHRTMSDHVCKREIVISKAKPKSYPARS